LTIFCLNACNHQRVQVHTISDNQLKCDDIKKELYNLKLVEKDIEHKTGFSVRNIGMGMVLWSIGIFINETNANQAEDAVSDRRAVLVKLHNEHNCESS
ncbi:MAG: hypothetical protein AAF195_01985, partial [Pseudomonadota bacterium]